MISGLHHSLEVPDLDVADGFLQDFGLETAEKDGSLVARCAGRDQDQVRPVQRPARSTCSPTAAPSRQHIGIAQWQHATQDVLPSRLGHALLFTAKPEEMTRSYTDVLGLRISDTIHNQEPRG